MSKRTQTVLKLFFSFLIGTAFLGWGSWVSAFTLGETKTFKISPAYDSMDRSQIRATLRFVGDKAVFYIDDDYWGKLTDYKIVNEVVSDLMVEFDQKIYPQLTKILGSEWSPGIDNELRVVVLIFKMKSTAGGYFDSTDEFPKSVLPLSNENELIYLNSSFLNTPRTKIYLAHEFQHLITFYQKEKLRNAVDDIWFNEARSEYVSTFLGYDDNFIGSNLQKRIDEFSRNSSDSLTEWQNENGDYGSVNLFLQYLISRYGQGLLNKIMKNELAGALSINQAMAESGFDEKFNNVFLNWVVANFYNDCLLGDGRKYCYFNPALSNFKVSPTLTNILPNQGGFTFSFSDKIKDWSGHWYKISGGGTDLNLNLEFSGEASANFQIPVVAENFNNERSIRFLKIDEKGKAKENFLGFGSQIKNIVLMPFSQGKISGFSANEPFHSFSFSVSLASSSAPVLTPAPATNNSATPIITPAPAPVNNPLPLSSEIKPTTYPDGSLLRAKNDFKVYVIKGEFKRWLKTWEILASYPHLLRQDIIETNSAGLDQYKNSWLVRANGDFRVYEINGDGTKHWLNMSAENFSNSGRDWKMVYEINKKELTYYQTGANVIR